MRITEIEICALPYEDEDAHAFTIKVCRRGPKAWALIRHGSCWDKVEKTWDYESVPSERTDEWLASHRYVNMREASEAAKEIAPFLTVNGWTVEQALRMHNGEELCGGLVVRGIRCSLDPGHEGDHKP